MTDKFLWVERYAPKGISDCILPTDIKTAFASYVESGEFPNLILAGPAGVGKTSLLITYFTGWLQDDYIPPVCDERLVKIEDVKILLCDTENSENYPTLHSSSIFSTEILILCFSLNNIDSFKDVYSIWYPEITKNCPNTPIILVGTKSDLRDNIEDNLGCVITSEEGQKMADDVGAVKYLECSSLLEKGVKCVINAAVYICKHNQDNQFS